MTLTVPREITHDFRSKLVLSHPSTGEKTSVPISFTGKQIDIPKYDLYDEEEE